MQLNSNLSKFKHFDSSLSKNKSLSINTDQSVDE